MSVALLDVNVLVALLDEAHIHHADAHDWLGRNRHLGWASCPITINGCIRIMSSPAYRDLRATAAEVAGRLREFCSSHDHHFWPDSVSLLDESLFQMPLVAGHQKITDTYLLGLAVRNHGRLATFDRSVPLNAVHGARPSHLAILGK